MATIYRYPFTKDEDGYPKITREMTPEQYDHSYKPMLEEMRKELAKNLESVVQGKCKNLDLAKIDYGRVVPVVQNTDYYKAFLYPAKGFPDRTLNLYGEFMMMTYMVLRYFGIEDALPERELLQIANYGDWHHKNGTWHHYIDVVCEAYGVETTRLSQVNQMTDYINDGGACVVLLDNRMFPNSIGNCLVFVTEILPECDRIKYYFPGGPEKSEHNRENNFKEFFENTKVIWGFKA